MASSARIEELERKFNENPRRYFAPLANEYRKAGDLEQAIAICRTYVPQQPAHMSGHIVFGQALFEAGEHEEARGVFEAALALDPENLIALRHLGDIARERGEMSAAKTWYQRVLDADPRNDEVATLLSALDGAPTRPPAADVPTWAEINPERTLELPPGILETATRETVLGAAAAHIRPAAAPIPPSASGMSDTLQPPPPSVPRPGWLRDTPVRVEDIPGPGLVDLEPLEVAPGKSLDPAAAQHAEAASAEPVDVGAHASVEHLPSLELERDATASHAYAGDTQESAPIGGLESMEFVAPARPEESAPPVHPSEAGVSAGGDETPAVFVTETMAELYLQQGFRDEALNVYRQLLAQNPNDATLRSRVEHLEGGAPSSVADAAAVDVAAPNGAGPVTVRSFFAALATRRWEGTADDLMIPPDVPAEESHPVADVVEPVAELPPQQPVAEVVAAEHDAPDAVVEAAVSESQPAAEVGSGYSASDSGGVAEHVTPADESAPRAPARGRASSGIKLDIDPLSHEDSESGSGRVMDEFGYGAIASIVAAGPSEYDVASYDAADMSGSMEAIEPAALRESAPAPTAPEPPAQAAAPVATEPVSPALPHPAESSEVNGSAPEAPIRRPMQTGSVSVLFPQQPVKPSDETAAATLSDAFGGPSPSVSATQGHPARPATNELSLDSIFRESAPRPEPRREPSAFSFDQFFTDAAPPPRGAPSPGSPSSGPPPAPTAEQPSADPPSDAEQFSSWLSGLKKK
jgi:tetratricopeptide (TPR) repeat protein